jgi:hypothetical protein
MSGTPIKTAVRNFLERIPVLNQTVLGARYLFSQTMQATEGLLAAKSNFRNVRRGEAELLSTQWNTSDVAGTVTSKRLEKC